MPTPLVKAHQFLAAILALFIFTHLAVHLTALGGAEQHISALSKVQKLYRHPLIEPVFILALLSQIFIGARLAAKRWHQTHKGFWGWTQILSGLYLAVFILAHTGAALFARHGFGLDTNFYWAAGTLNVGWLPYFFAPYYLLGITSVFAHLAAALYFGRKTQHIAFPTAILLLGFGIALLIVTTFGGVFYEIHLPEDYLTYFGKYPGL